MLIPERPDGLTPEEQRNLLIQVKLAEGRRDTRVVALTVAPIGLALFELSLKLAQINPTLGGIGEGTGIVLGGLGVIAGLDTLRCIGDEIALRRFLRRHTSPPQQP